jgi:predicted PurR-regulated permease PerM
LIAIVIRPFWEPALWALAVTTSLWQLREHRLEIGKFNWAYRPWAMTLWVALCLLVPFGLVTASITVEATNAAAKLTDPAQRQLLIEGIRAKFTILTPYLARFHITPEDLPSKVAEHVGPLLGSFLSMVASAAGTLLIDCAFFLLFTYIFFSRGAAMAETLQRALPQSAVGGVRVAEKALSCSLLGVVATAVVQGTLGGIGCFTAGLPSPLLFFLAMAIASLIPGIGTFLIWGPAAAWLAISGNYWAAGGLAAWGILVIGSVDNFLRPVISARFGNMDFMVATLGSLGGLALFGFSGVLLGPALLAAGIELLRKEDV